MARETKNKVGLTPQPRIPAVSMLGTPDTPSELQIKVDHLHRMLDNLSGQVRVLAAEHDSESVKFDGLGFRSAAEAGAWIDTHTPDYSFGYIVDAHIILEHIWTETSGERAVERLSLLYKMKIDDPAKGLAMSSFETRMPRYFSSKQHLSAVTQEDSYFDRVPTKEEWDQPYTGFKDRLKEGLHNFELYHQRMIQDRFDPSDRVYGVARNSCMKSVEFLHGLILFCDDLLKELERSFSKKKAWSLVTRLARRILFDISLPRNGVQNQFKAGEDHGPTCKAIFWSVVQSLDIMAAFKSKNFKDHPSIASEFVKFFVTNAATDSIEKLSKKLDSVEEQVKGLASGLKGATSVAATASNQVTKLTAEVKDLAKRISKLEK